MTIIGPTSEPAQPGRGPYTTPHRIGQRLLVAGPRHAHSRVELGAPSLHPIGLREAVGVAAHRLR